MNYSYVSKFFRICFVKRDFGSYVYEFVGIIRYLNSENSFDF